MKILRKHDDVVSIGIKKVSNYDMQTMKASLKHACKYIFCNNYKLC